jgi:predicted  nucleic acid-binding Zn-ribbon protein
MSDASILLELATADRTLLRLRKQLDELPQRAKLLELRTKRVEVGTKAEQVARMRKECEQAIKLLQDEESMLKDKTAEVQKHIDQTSNYKEVVAFTREIEGFAKRREKIEFDMLKQLERSDKITQVEEQVNGALERLAKQDGELLSSYQEQAGTLKREMLTTQKRWEGRVKELSPDLLGHYKKAREAKGGLGSAHIEGTHCSVCRVELTEGQLTRLRASGEVGECPYCHRLLVVKA